MYRIFFVFLMIVLPCSVSLAQQKANGRQIDSLMRLPSWKKNRNIEDLARSITQHFYTPHERYRAAFAWTAQNIRYDLSKLNDQKLYSHKELVVNTMKERSALCEGYVAVLDSLCKLMYIETIKVPGYTRWSGKLQPEPHLWLAVQLGGHWQLSDPTWASGAIVNGRYRAEYDTLWFLVAPEQMIGSHMPYDPVFQLLQEPFSHAGFIRNTHQKLPGIWHPADSLKKHMRLDLLAQLEDERRRLRQNFFHHALQTRIEYLDKNIEVIKRNRLVETMQNCSAALNIAVRKYNEAVEAFNRRRPKNKVMELLQDAEQLLHAAKQMLPHRDNITKSLLDEWQTLSTHIGHLEKRIREAKNNWH